MPRSVTISLPAEKAGILVDQLAQLDGILTLSRLKEASVVPPGDVVALEVLDRCISEVFSVLALYGLGTDEGISATTNEPTAVVSASSAKALAKDPASTTFEEVEGILEREATMGPNKTAAMFFAGAIAAVGLLANSVHLVIGAMLIAPGFEPFLKVALRVTGRTRSFRRGFFDIAVGWLAVMLGAAAGRLILGSFGVSLESPTGGYGEAGELVAYWRNWSPTATLVSVVAAAAGTVLVVGSRAVLTAGVMVALALVPGAALVGIALVEADSQLAAEGALRWLHDAAIVTTVGAAVFMLYRAVSGRALADR